MPGFSAGWLVVEVAAELDDTERATRVGSEKRREALLWLGRSLVW